MGFHDLDHDDSADDKIELISVYDDDDDDDDDHDHDHDDHDDI